MLKDKRFWVGFLLAYGLVSFAPAVSFKALFGKRKSS